MKDKKPNIDINQIGEKNVFFNDLEIMNRKFNTRQTDDFVNLTQYLLIFSQRKKSRTHSCLHNGKKPIGQ